MSQYLIKDETILKQLALVQDNMKKQTKSADTYLNGSLDYLLATGGKMLRPMLLLIGSRMGRVSKKQQEDLIQIATAIETMHLATLVHDDIIDQATMRRGRESIQAKYGPSYAVYMGDYLLSQCFLMLTHLNLKKDQALRLAKVVQRICVGDMKQHQVRYNLSITPYQYIKIVSGKTAALIATALSSGAYYTRVKEEHVKLLGRIGYEMGMTFQLIDDLLDYIGDEVTVGKDLRSDLLRGYYSMPVIYALQSDAEYSEPLRELLSHELKEEDLAVALQLIHGSGAVEMTKDLAIRYNQRAAGLIDQLPEGDTRTLLAELLPNLLQRIM